MSEMQNPVSHGRNISLKLFLEGQEVDCISATVECGKNVPASAQIVLPAPPKPFEFEARTLVHLFFYDDSPAVLPDVGGKESAAVRFQIASTGDRTDARAWRLLFCGEALAYQFVKAGSERQLVLQCQDLTTYWESIQLFWGVGGIAAVSSKHAVAAGAVFLKKGGVTKDGGQLGGTDALVNILAGRSTTRPTIPGLLGGIVGLLEWGTGVYDGPLGKRTNFRGLNDWASAAELRLHLTRTIAASPEDDTSAAFLDVGDLRQYFRQVAASCRSTASLLTLADSLLGKTYHIRSSIACPPYMPEGAPMTLQRMVPAGTHFPSKNLDELDRKAEKVYQLYEGRAELARQAEIASKTAQATSAQLTDGAANEVKGGKVVKAGQAHKDFAKSATETGLIDSPEAMQKWTPEQGDQTSVAAPLFAAVQKDLEPMVASGRSGASEMAQAVDQLHDGVVAARIPVTFARMASIDGQPAPTDDGTEFGLHTYAALHQAATAIQDARERLKRALHVPMKAVKVRGTTHPALHMTMLAPDLFMVPPPKCNVLFPTHYMNVQFSRSWLQEVTRLILHGQYRSGQETSTLYFSPNRTTGLIGPSDKSVAQALQSGMTFLMPHELVTGPIPAFDSIGDMAVFRRINRKLVETDKKKSPKSQMYDAQEFLQRAANFLFVSKRFESRQMSVECRFSPQMVPGLPVLVLDPPDGAVDGLGTHYVGQLSSLTHQFTATGGCSTSARLEKCRRTDEGPDLWSEGPYDHVTRRSTVKTTTTRASIPTTAAGLADGAIDPTLKGIAQTVGLPADAFTGGLQMTGQSPLTLPGTGGVGRELKFEYKGGSATVTAREVQAVPGSNVGAGEVAAIVATSPLGAVGLQGPQIEVTVDREVTTKKSRKVEMSFETAFTPPWFATIYHAYNVGTSFYLPQLGCQSVVDEPELLQMRDRIQPTANDVTATDIDGTTGTITLKIGSGADSTEMEVPANLVQYPALTTQDAADRLSELYLRIKRAGADASGFADRYCARAYASLPDIMGNPVDQLEWHLKLQEPLHFLKTGGDAIGFHANAYGDMSGLRDVFQDPMQEEPLASATDTTKGSQPTVRPLDASVDMRARHYENVRQYRELLLLHRSNMGRQP